MAPVIKVGELIAALQTLPTESLCFFSDGENYRPITKAAQIKLYECNDWWFDELKLKKPTIIVYIEGSDPLTVKFSSGDTVRQIVSKVLGRDNWEWEYGVTNDEGYYKKNDRPDGSLPLSLFRYPYPCINTVMGSYIKHGDPDYMYGIKTETLRMYLNINLFTKVMGFYKNYSENPNPVTLQLVLLEKALKNIFA